MQNALNGAAGEAMPDCGAVPPFFREEHHPVEAAFVRTLPADELTIFEDALEAMSEALLGILNRPNCVGALRDWLQAESDRLDDARSYAVQELERRPMTGFRLEDERRIAHVAAWHLKECGAGTLETLAKLARMLAAHEDAASAVRRKR